MIDENKILDAIVAELKDHVYWDDNNLCLVFHNNDVEKNYKIVAERLLKALIKELPKYNMMAVGTKKPALAYHYLIAIGDKSDD